MTRADEAEAAWAVVQEKKVLVQNACVAYAAVRSGTAEDYGKPEAARLIDAFMDFMDAVDRYHRDYSDHPRVVSVARGARITLGEHGN